MRKIWRIAIILLIFIVAIVVFLFIMVKPKPLKFDGKNALIYAEAQIAMGPRTPGSSSHLEFQKWSSATFSQYGWNVQEQIGETLGHPLVNIIAKKGSGENIFIIGAHYDSRLKADQDATTPEIAVPGANDGASGVAVIIELARTLEIPQNKQVWLVLFDLEDQGNINSDWDWILGSSYFVEQLEVSPKAVVVVDMIGDRNLEIKREQTSDQRLINEIWGIADDLGYSDKFLNIRGFSMLDDHTPFLNKGISAVDLIDFDYPFWHTTADTMDKINADSLHAVGSVLENWLER